MADENGVWIFVGVLIGVPLGLVCGWILAQIAAPKGSTVVVQKLDSGYIIKETHS